MKRVILAGGILLIVLGLNTDATVVQFEDGRKPMDLLSMAVDSTLYYRFDEFCHLVGGSWSWEPSVGRAVLRRGDDSLAVTVGSPFFIANNRPLHAEHPVLLQDGVIWIPYHFLDSADLLFADVQMRLSAGGDSVFVEDHVCDIHVMSFRQDSLSTALSLLLPSGSTWSISPLRNRRCTVTILGADLCMNELDSLDVQEPLRRLAGEQLLGRASIHMTFSTSDLSVHARQPAGGGPLTVTVEQSSTPGTSPEPPARPYELQTVVIDAGHGGDNEGVLSRRGVREKDVAASIASDIVSILKRRSPELDVVLTRTGDADVGLESRIEAANNQNGDLFISIHCNASFNRSMKGFQVFFLAPSVTDAARYVAARENAVLPEEHTGSPADSGMTFLPWDRIHDAWLSHSMMIARSVTEAARRRLDTTVHDPAQAALYILSGVDMPSVLIEAGYLTNAIEARKLADDQYLEQIALAVVEGIEEYTREQESMRSEYENNPPSMVP